MENYSNKSIVLLLKISLFLSTVFFIGGTPSSLRGLYYVVWIYFCYRLYKKGDFLPEWIKKRPFGTFFTYVFLGVTAIIAEETIASISVNILAVHSLSELIHYMFGYYANNLLLLPGFIVAWYFLIRKYNYSQREMYTLVGLFGILSEKLYIHFFTNPLIAVTLLLPTMVTYMGIIMIPFTLLKPEELGTTPAGNLKKIVLGICIPFIISIPFVILHTVLAKAGAIDPEILRR
jgi:hypothetical protein